MTQRHESDSVSQVTQDGAFEYEWRLTYAHSLTGGGVEREGFGLDENGARRALTHYRENPDITELRLWRRPKPMRWEETE